MRKQVLVRNFAFWPKSLQFKYVCFPSHFEILKGIFSDSNNFFLWHESKDINGKSFFPKFQLITILRFELMHDYVCFIVPIVHCVGWILVYENFFKIALISYWNDLGLILLGKVGSIVESFKIMQRIQILKILRAPSTSVSMPLNFAGETTVHSPISGVPVAVSRPETRPTNLLRLVIGLC